MFKPKQCAICSQFFVPDSARQMRCKKCANPRCSHCGKVFRPALHQGGIFAKYCSRQCYFAHRWNASGKCANCGKASKTKFCSPTCQKEFWNKNGYVLQKKRRYWERKVELINSLGGKCTQCGFDDIRALDINHIDRNRKQRAKQNHWTWTRRFADWEKNKGNLELLCANCHRIHTWGQMNYGIGNVI